MKKAHRSEFLKLVKERFPEIKDKINKENGLLTFEVSIFVKFIQGKINSSDKQAVIDAFNILSEFYVNGNLNLKHTIRNAVCEDLDLSITATLNRAWAFDALPEPLKVERRHWFKLMGYESE